MSITQSVNASAQRVEVPKSVETATPAIFQVVHKAADLFIDYHRDIFQKGNTQGQQVARTAEAFTKWCFTPITYIKPGKAVQKFIAEKVVGKLAFCVTFSTLQLFHLIPYITAAAFIAGTLFLYQIAPEVPMILFLGAGFFATYYSIFYDAKQLINEGINQSIDQVEKKLVIRIEEAKPDVTKKITEIAETYKTQIFNKVDEKVDVLNNRISPYETLIPYVKGTLAAVGIYYGCSAVTLLSGH